MRWQKSLLKASHERAAVTTEGYLCCRVQAAREETAQHSAPPAGGTGPASSRSHAFPEWCHLNPIPIPWTWGKTKNKKHTNCGQRAQPFTRENNAFPKVPGKTESPQLHMAPASDAPSSHQMTESRLPTSTADDSLMPTANKTGVSLHFWKQSNLFRHLKSQNLI